MHVLLMSGLGPSFKNENLLRDTLFDPQSAPGLSRDLYGGSRLESLAFLNRGKPTRLLRAERGRGSLSLSLPANELLAQQKVPHLTTYSLEAILQRCGASYEAFPLPALWEGTMEPSGLKFDAILLSTTFIWDRNTLGRAIKWVTDRFPAAPLILGGQYSNLKYVRLLRDFPEVTYIVRGDGEHALPRLLQALQGKLDFDDVPNLVQRVEGTDRILAAPISYIDLDAELSPSLPGKFPIMPYESMRGCPFSCKFCSFPHASPVWRYKSAEKITSDWRRYAEDHGTVHVRASDSTFTVPPTRLSALLDLLPSVGVGWEAFARANAIKKAETVERLKHANCRWLSIGFESMSDATLKKMKKQVTARNNRQAVELLANGGLGFRGSFMIGYPGETPEDFMETQDYIVSDYYGHFMLNIFSMQDETMPVWEDAARYDLKIEDLDNPDAGWSHVGMDLAEARSLLSQALQRIRWSSDKAVHLLWQKDYESPLMPGADVSTNLYLEKLVERYATVGQLGLSQAAAQAKIEELGSELARYGVFSTRATAGPLMPANATYGDMTDTTAIGLEWSI